MHTSLKLILAFSFISIMFYSCASMSDVLQSKNEGSVQTFSVNLDRAWEISITVLRWEGCETIEEHKSEGYMLTTVGQNWVSSGTLVGVWIEKEDQINTKITIVTKRKMQTELATGLTETTFLRRFAQAVDIVNSGNKLSLEPPTYE